MTYRSFSLMPTLGNSIFSDRFTQMDNLFSRLTGEKPINETPPYNLKKNKDKYELVVSVPGFLKNELDVSVLNNQLIINGKPNVDNKETNNNDKESVNKWLHQGIQKNEFSISFNLEYRINIKNSSLNNGLLTIQFTYDIPEQEKPKKINIGMQNETGRVIEHNVS
ncbi:MAG: Hsp20 family protein (plasmid) [Pantoea sp. Brub]|nr:Hsp20 family protein [Pantoea sp. Brub]